MDFTVAERYDGIPGIQSTFSRAMEHWKDYAEYLTELVIALNQKGWQHYEAGNQELADLYAALYYQAYDYAAANLKGDKLQQFLDATD